MVSSDHLCGLCLIFTFNNPWVGLIRWKIVIHCIIDGYSRFVLGIRVHNNNRAASVLRLFLDSIQLNGLPSRMRGDHGVENVDVARYMEEQRGADRGSFIWGRCVLSVQWPLTYGSSSHHINLLEACTTLALSDCGTTSLMVLGENGNDSLWTSRQITVWT